MSPIRTYPDAWNGAMQSRPRPPAGSADRGGLRPAVAPPATPANGTTPEPADDDRWLAGPGNR